MKISREKKKATGKNNAIKLGLFLTKWYSIVGIFLLAFVLGAFLYRGGYLTPLTAFTKNFLRNGPRVFLNWGPVKEAARSVDGEIRLYQNNSLPTLKVDIKFEDYQQLLDKREEALRIGILNTTNDDYVDAVVQLQDDQKLDAKIRLKGDWTDHLVGEKWSFRINLKEEGEIFHMREFSIESPDTRNFLYEWAFHNNLLEEGVLTTRYDFVNVMINGKNLGIYAIEEGFAPEMIESQGRRQGVIIRFDEDLLWENRTTFWSNDVIQEPSFMVTNTYTAEVTLFNSGDVTKNPALTEQANKARELLSSYQKGILSASEVFDLELMGRFYALSDLWDACHGIYWHNVRFYYNPVTGLLEPIAYDNEPFRWCDQGQSIISDIISRSDLLFNNEYVRAAYARELERISVTEYVEELEAELSAEQERLAKALQIEFPLDNVRVDWGALKNRAQALSLELQPAQPIRGNYQLIGANPGSTQSPSLALDLKNLMVLPVELDRIEIDGLTLNISDGPIDLPQISDPLVPSNNVVHLVVPLDNLMQTTSVEPPLVEAVVRLVGLKREFKVQISGEVMPEDITMGPVPHQPTINEVLRQHPFLDYNPEQRQLLLVSQGIWDVKGDFILPDDVDLIVPAGTVLRFGEGNILYTTGALKLLGQVNAPVILTAQGETWGGIVVSSAERGSIFEYASVEKTGGIDRDGWMMTGGITFYKSKIELSHAIIGNNQTEDAINVIHGVFNFHDSEFLNTFADAFDSDFSTGEITDCYFHDITGDAFDVSGTEATISNSRMERITDKGVSVGEISTITIQNVTMDTVGIGVASKDLSTAIVTGTEIRNASFAALAAYVKKPVYGPAKIEASDIVITDSEREAIAQDGNIILLRGEQVETVPMDVDLLYSQGILGN